ncbi:2-oxoglutarate-dependent dioxygenase DAO-like isoform X1 [Vigna umbellata]|uniref:2-oxoglutarate-dependent dioxygenase DAO-like isoform X1 n=1 Tax=Vigna umbellata TaxID=87088 RepID=UPI001F5FC7CA|nr:2-oxoglutarate-dependent dioxygenase DAO-like isoform X1 [Vigna umbellata]
MAEKFPVVIDVQKIGEEEELKKLREACEKWGSFRIINHSIPPTLVADMKKVVEALHDLPFETKKRNTEAIAGGGYVGPTPLSPLYEAIGIYDISSSQSMHNFCSQLHVSPQQRQIMEAYGQAVHGLAVKIGQKMAESLGVVEGADFEDWLYEFRFNKYNFTAETIGSPGVQIHTDSSFLSVLKDDENVGGLEVMDSSSSFVPIPLFPGTFLVNLGDIARVWSNGRFCNLIHRVQCKEANKRFSIATFMLAPRNRNVEAPEELVNHDHPRLYRPFIYEDYRKLRFTNKMYIGEVLELLRLSLS